MNAGARCASLKYPEAPLLEWRNDDHDYTTTAVGRHEHEKRRNGRQAGGLAFAPSAEGPVGMENANANRVCVFTFLALPMKHL